MDIMRLFGRVFASSPAAEDAEEAKKEEEPAKMVMEEKEEEVVVARDKKSVVANGHHHRQTASRGGHQIQVYNGHGGGGGGGGGGDDGDGGGSGGGARNRLSVCEYSVSVTEEREEGDKAATNNNVTEGEEERNKQEEEEEATPECISGTDWESAFYEVEMVDYAKKYQEEGDEAGEVAAVDVNDRFIVLQYLADPQIDVFDRAKKERLFQLLGHSYGGHCLRLCPGDSDLLYSGSLDKTVRSWNLGRRAAVETIYNHLDYVESLGLLADKWVASGGRGDKAIFVYETDRQGKLWRRHRFDGHEGWVTHLVFPDEHTLVSGSEDATVRVWDLRCGRVRRVLRQDEAISCLAILVPDVLVFGDAAGKLSLLDLDTRETIHLLPNILVGTGRYCRSSKYHDKAVDAVYPTGNGYLITASTGSKFIKVWRIKHGPDPTDHSSTEVTELQILREHADYLTAFSASGATLVSAGASGGNIVMHTFPTGEPHYEMARADEEEAFSAAALAVSGGMRLVEAPERPTEVCPGPRLCKTGKTGLVRSSSSFQVSFQLKPRVATTECRMRLPKRLPATLKEEEWSSSSSSSSSSDCDIEISSTSSSEDEDEGDDDGEAQER